MSKFTMSLPQKPKIYVPFFFPAPDPDVVGFAACIVSYPHRAVPYLPHYPPKIVFQLGLIVSFPFVLFASQLHTAAFTDVRFSIFFF